MKSTNKSSKKLWKHRTASNWENRDLETFSKKKTNNFQLKKLNRIALGTTNRDPSQDPAGCLWDLNSLLYSLARAQRLVMERNVKRKDRGGQEEDFTCNCRNRQDKMQWKAD